MALEYPAEWRFEPLGIAMPRGAHAEFEALVAKIARVPSETLVVETFKAHFGRPTASTSLSWAYTDLSIAMGASMDDAVEYVDHFWSAIEKLRSRGIGVPRVQVLNAILTSHAVPLLIEPPVLRHTGADAVVTTTTALSSTATGHANGLIRGALIGQGGFGSVYKATRHTSVAGFEYALKLLDPSAFVANREKAAARFTRESVTLQRLQHRAIVPYIETGMAVGDQPYILMPFIDGATLTAASMVGDLPRLLWTFQEILGGLSYLHSRQVIHRDLKPSNVMIRASDGQPLILDFGCAYLFDDQPETTLTTALLGSAGYVPPEVIANPKLRTPQQDVFACGVMLYEALMGCRPDVGDYVPVTRAADGGEAMDEIIRAAIAPAASQRFASAEEFSERLATLR